MAVAVLVKMVVVVLELLKTQLHQMMLLLLP
jgi:hypothetical protein